MNRNLKALMAVLTISTLGALSCSAQQPIVGTIDFGGVVTFDTTSLATATMVDQWNSSFVLQSSGDFSSVSPGTPSTMVPQWTFNQGTPGSPSPGPATPGLWNVGGFTFDLSSSNVMPVQTSNFLHVTGTGTVSSTNSSFATTPGIWSFTSSNSNGQDQTTFGFQANASVPEAGTFTLLAIGVIGLGGIALVRRKPAHHHHQ